MTTGKPVVLARPMRGREMKSTLIPTDVLDSMRLISAKNGLKGENVSPELVKPKLDQVELYHEGYVGNKRYLVPDSNLEAMKDIVNFKMRPRKSLRYKHQTSHDITDYNHFREKIDSLLEKLQEIKSFTSLTPSSSEKSLKGSGKNSSIQPEPEQIDNKPLAEEEKSYVSIGSKIESKSLGSRKSEKTIESKQEIISDKSKKTFESGEKLNDNGKEPESESHYIVGSENGSRSTIGSQQKSQHSAEQNKLNAPPKSGSVSTGEKSKHSTKKDDLNEMPKSDSIHEVGPNTSPLLTGGKSEHSTEENKPNEIPKSESPFKECKAESIPSEEHSNHKSETNKLKEPQKSERAYEVEPMAGSLPTKEKSKHNIMTDKFNKLPRSDSAYTVYTLHSGSGSPLTEEKSKEGIEEDILNEIPKPESSFTLGSRTEFSPVNGDFIGDDNKPKNASANEDILVSKDYNSLLYSEMDKQHNPENVRFLISGHLRKNETPIFIVQEYDGKSNVFKNEKISLQKESNAGNINIFVSGKLYEDNILVESKNKPLYLNTKPNKMLIDTEKSKIYYNYFEDTYDVKGYSIKFKGSFVSNETGHMTPLLTFDVKPKQNPDT